MGAAPGLTRRGQRCPAESHLVLFGNEGCQLGPGSQRRGPSGSLLQGKLPAERRDSLEVPLVPSVPQITGVRVEPRKDEWVGISSQSAPQPHWGMHQPFTLDVHNEAKDQEGTLTPLRTQQQGSQEGLRLAHQLKGP